MAFTRSLILLTVLTILSQALATIPSFGLVTAEEKRAKLSDDNFKINLSNGIFLTDDHFTVRFANLSISPALAALDVQFLVSDAVLAPGQSFLTHYHPRSAEIVYVTQGEVLSTFSFEGINGRDVAVSIKEGEYGIIPQGLIHDAACTSTVECRFTAIFKTADPGFVPIDLN